MEFLKKHYEKIILSAVLLGLAVVSAMLPMKMAGIREQFPEVVEPRNPDPVEPTDLTPAVEAFAKMDNPPLLDLKGHNVINTVQWRERPDGSLVKIADPDELGPMGTEISVIRPLYLRIEFLGVDSGSGVRPRYRFAISQEAHIKSSERGRKERRLEVGTANEVFLLKSVEGDPQDPRSAVLDLEDGPEITVQRSEPFEMIEGYAVDFTYPRERKEFRDKRLGDAVYFNSGTQYYITAVTEDEVVFMDYITGIRYAKTWDQAPKKP